MLIRKMARVNRVTLTLIDLLGMTLKIMFASS